MSNMTCTNISFENLIPEKELWKIVLLAFLTCFPFITIAGNILVIYTVLKRHKFKQKANVFVVSLAVADIAVAIFVMSFAILKQFGDMIWLTFRSVCFLSVSFDVMFTSTSIFHLMCMTIDRFIAICLPFKYHSYMSNRNVAALLVICWCLPFVISFGFIFGEVHTIGVELYWDCPNKCILVVNIYYAIICSLIVFYVPSLFMLVCNLKIFWEVRQKGRQLCELSKSFQRQQHDKLMKREVKVARTIAILLSCFFLCWLPFFILNIVDPLIGYTTSESTLLIITWLGYINSTINPYLYYFLNKQSKGCFKHSKCCFTLKVKCRRNKNMYVLRNLNMLEKSHIP